MVDFKTINDGLKEMVTHPHRTAFYHILWFWEGTKVHMVDFEPISVEPNTLLFLNQDLVHSFDPEGSFKGKAVIFTDAFFCQNETDTTFLNSTILFNDLFHIAQVRIPSHDSTITTLLQHIEKEQQYPKDKYQADILRNDLRNLLLHCERERKRQHFEEIKPNVHLDYVIAFRNLLDKEYKKAKQVKYYADLMHVSTKRLNQSTSQILGKSPKELIDHRVVLEAKRLLVYTRLSVKEIGFELGFEEPTNFVKYFRKQTTVTPIDFRENQQ